MAQIIEFGNPTYDASPIMDTEKITSTVCVVGDDREFAEVTVTVEYNPNRTDSITVIDIEYHTEGLFYDDLKGDIMDAIKREYQFRDVYEINYTTI